MQVEAPISNPPKAYLDIILPLITRARELLETGERLAPIAFVGNLTDVQVIPVVLNPGSDEAKDESAETIRRSASIINADFIFMIMEAWSLRPDKLHRVNEIMDEYGSIGNSPYAIDVASMTLETRHGVWVAQMPIKPKGISKKKRTIAVPVFRHYTEVKGRFVDLLPAKPGDEPPAMMH